MQRIYRDNLLREIINNAMDAFIIIDDKNVIVEWSQQAISLFGWEESEALGKVLHTLIAPLSASIYQDGFIKSEANTRVEVIAHRKNGTEFPIEVTITPVKIESTTYFSASIRDLTKQKKDHDELIRQASLLDLSRDGIYVVDSDHKLILWSKGAEALYGYTSAEALGKISYQLLKTDYTFQSISPGTSFIDIVKHLAKAGRWEGELRQKTKTDDEVIVLSRWAWDPVTREVLVTNTNITELKKNRDRVEYLATHDELTGLPNRKLLDDRISHAIAQCNRFNGYVGVLLMDLDRFKVINDSLGHNRGDDLLKEIAKRLKRAVRVEDTVARLGGDEFIIVLENVSSIEDIADIANKILKSISEPITLDQGAGKNITINTSIGAAVYPKDGKNIDELLRNADLAMYRSKEMESGAFRFYSPEMNELVLQRLLNENSLRHALNHGEFILHFQPKICSVENRTTGVEALIRWKHPEKGLIFPSDFIQLAEEMGLITAIGEWVLFKACEQNKAWQDMGLPPIQMSVNLSVHQLVPSMVETVAKALRISGLDPKWLDLEVTESSAMRNVEVTLDTLGKLRDLGVTISIDDFGTGYSSLAYLKKMPLDCLKIDQSFVNGIPNDSNDLCIVSSIISLAHNMKLRVIAEGVTTSEQVAFLDTLKCDEMQGYLFSRPMSAEDVEKTMIKQVWRFPYSRIAAVN